MLLGINAAASREEIDAAWHAAIKQVHPDTNGGTGVERTTTLNQAHELVVAAVPGSELAVREMRTELDRFRGEDVGRRNSERAIKKVVMHHVGDLAFRKRQRVTIAAVSGGIAAILALVSALGKYAFIAPVAGLFALSFGVLGGVAGLWAWRLSTRERMLELDIEEVGETLSDRAAVAGTLDELNLGERFDRDELHDAIDRWEIPEGDAAPHHRPPNLIGSRQRPAALARTAKAIGSVDFGRLLLAKGAELGLLTEDATDDENGVRRYGYRRV